MVFFLLSHYIFSKDITVNKMSIFLRNLHIHNVQIADEGAYMCQINTPKAKTRLSYLNVVGKSNNFMLYLTFKWKWNESRED